ncbi:MAG TPA: hypothetical protein VGI22_22975 [Xanthobacteraceae bacterium]
MAKAQLRFREVEIARALRAAARAGREVTAISISKTGEVSLQIATPREAEERPTAA